MTKQKNKETVYTPKGIISYPYLAAPDTGRTYSSNKFTCDFFIDKDVFKKEGKPIVDAILKVAKDFYGRTVMMADIRHPLVDCADDDKLPDRVRNCWKIRAKTSFKPDVIGPRKVNGEWKNLTEDQVKAIKSGDVARLVLAFYPYEQSGGGIAAGLQMVQFIEEGEAIGQGKTAALSILEENETTVDELSADDVEAVAEVVETKLKPAAKAPAAKAKPAPAAKAKPAPAPVEETDEFDFIGN